ncbi:O-antigen ligase family protein [Natronospora cellulosivora (SeqCode)]
MDANKNYVNESKKNILKSIIEVLLLLFIISFTFSISAGNIFLGLLFIFYIVYKIKRKDLSISSGLFNKYVLFFFLLSIFSFLKADDLSASTHMIVSPILRYIIFYFIATEFINTENMKKYLNTFLLSNLIFVLYGIFNYYNNMDFLISPNQLGTLVTFIFFFFISFSMHKEQNLPLNILYFFLSLASIIILYATNSRGAVLGFIVSLLLWFGMLVYKNIENKKILSSMFVLFLVLTTSFFYFLPDNLLEKFTLLQDIESSGSLNTRVIMWESSWEMIKSNPVLGVGVGNYRLNFQNYLDEIGHSQRATRHRHPHNLFLYIAAEQGVFSLLVFLFMYYKAYLLAFENFAKYKVMTKKSILGLILAAQLTSLFIHSFVDSTARFGYVGYFILIFVVFNEKVSNDFRRK